MRLDNRNRLVFDGPSLRIGEFRCARGDEAWSRVNVAEEHYVVFPRVPVEIAPGARSGAGHAVVADPNWVMFYNPGQVYRRRVLHDRGDECEWFRVRTDLLRSAAWAYDAGAHDREPGALFPFAHGPGGAREFLGQRRVYRAALAGGDPLEIEEAFLTVLARVVGDAYRFRGGRRPARPDAATARAHARATEEAKKVLALRFRERLTLDVISDAVELSPFHLCRVFRAHTGRSIHRYVTSLRVRSAVERLEEGGTVREGAEWAGFSSHGHFTNAFVREFGVTPRSLQRRPGPTLG